MPDKINFKYLVRQELMAEMSDDAALYTIHFCMNLGLIANWYKCPKCGKEMKLLKRTDIRDGYEWSCRAFGTGSHHVKRSVRSGSFFAESRMGLMEILQLTECFVRERTQKDCRDLLNLSDATVCEWRNCFREVCLYICTKETGLIGGVGVIVEMGETEFCKTSCNKANRVEGNWVFGGVERGTNKCFLRIVDKRNKKSLLNIIKSCILPGTTIVSNFWKSYDCLEDEGFKELMENQSIEFRDPKSLADTNGINGTWAAIKRKLPLRTATDRFDTYLGEYIWRRYHNDSKDLMKTFLEGIQLVYPPRVRD